MLLSQGDKADILQLNALDQRHLCHMLGTTWCDHVTNKEFCNQTDQPPLSEIIQCRSLVFALVTCQEWHLLWTHWALFCTIPTNWRRPGGKPRQTWLATVTSDLDQPTWHLHGRRSWELTANCTLWQGLINMALCTNLVDAPDDDEKHCL